MPYLLGIEIGDSTVTAAMCRPPHVRPADAGAMGAWGPPQPVALGVSGPVIASTLLLAPGGDLVAADGGAAHAADQAYGFVHRVGDDVPVLLADHPFPAQVLMAGMAGWVIGRLWQLQGQAPESIAVAHPTGWGPYRLDLLRAAFDQAGLGEPALVSRAGAVVTSFQSAGRLPAGGTMLLVFRLGGSSLEISLVNLHTTGLFELITSVESTDINGSDLNAADAAAQRAILRAGVDLAARTVQACGIHAENLAGVLLAGAAAGYAQLTDLLTVDFPVTILRDDDPRMTVACGAALSVRPRTPRVPAVPAPIGQTAMVAMSSLDEEPLAESISPGPQAVLPPPRPPVRVTAAPAGRR
ncbi:MAG: hypothetical protein ABW000_08115 [Actinoplanes sp.]